MQQQIRDERHGQAADPARVATFAFSADVLALGILAWPRKLGGGKELNRIDILVMCT